MRRPVLALVLALLCILSVKEALAVCAASVPVFHGLDSYFACDNSRGPVTAFAYLAIPFDSRTPTNTNSGTENIAVGSGPGRIQIQADWGNAGMLGCPRDASGNHRIIIAVQGNDGRGVLASISGADANIGYLVEAAHPFDPVSGLAFPVPCSDSNSRPQIVSRTPSTLNLHVDPPHIVSDCDPGSVGMAALGDTCPDNLGAVLATASLAGVYTSTQVCDTAPVVSTSAWTRTSLPVDAIDTTPLPYVLPDNTANGCATDRTKCLCLFIGTTISIAGNEGASIVGFTSIPGIGCLDADGDGISTCEGDCRDDNPAVFPGHPEICDGVDNNCNGAVDEGLGQTTCGLGACRVTVNNCVNGTPQTCVPGSPSPEICNGVDDDCNGVIDDRDLDRDGYSACGADCDDGNSQIHPGAVEICNGIDDDCNGLIDDDAAGVDSDGDGVRNACDNCRSAFNPTQMDDDHDGAGNACDNCLFIPNPGQSDLDSDQRGDACDNCPAQYNPTQDDTDADRVGDACDDCPFDPNSDQHDIDGDLEGDACDLNDGLILVSVLDGFEVDWQREAGFDSFNEYRGDLAVLKSSGLYTQRPDLVPLAGRSCGLTDPFAFDAPDPPLGQAVFYLVTGSRLGVEGSLGTNSAGVERPNANPCP